MRTPAGRDGLVLYLDYDGVLHHEKCLWHPKRGAYLDAPPRYSLFQHAELLVEVLAPFPTVQIVLSTSWQLQYGFSASKKRLPPTLQERVVGGTFHKRHMRKSEFFEIPRGEQVVEDVMRRRPAGWLALDDNYEGWPKEHMHRWIQTDPYEGISDPAVLANLKEKLEALCKPTKTN